MDDKVIINKDELLWLFERVEQAAWWRSWSRLKDARKEVFDKTGIVLEGGLKKLIKKEAE